MLITWQSHDGQMACRSHIHVVYYIVKTSLQTLLKRKATGEKGPATELEPGTYTLSRSFSHTSHRSQPQILRLPSPYVPDKQCIIFLYDLFTSLRWVSRTVGPPSPVAHISLCMRLAPGHSSCDSLQGSRGRQRTTLNTQSSGHTHYNTSTQYATKRNAHYRHAQ